MTTYADTSYLNNTSTDTSWYDTYTAPSYMDTYDLGTYDTPSTDLGGDSYSPSGFDYGYNDTTMQDLQSLQTPYDVTSPNYGNQPTVDTSLLLNYEAQSPLQIGDPDYSPQGWFGNTVDSVKNFFGMGDDISETDLIKADFTETYNKGVANGLTPQEATAMAYNKSKMLSDGRYNMSKDQGFWETLRKDPKSVLAGGTLLLTIYGYYEKNKKAEEDKKLKEPETAGRNAAKKRLAYLAAMDEGSPAVVYGGSSTGGGTVNWNPGQVF